MTIKIEFVESPSFDELDVIHNGLTTHAMEHIQTPGFACIAFFHRDADGSIDAGIVGHLNWNWASIYNFWVRDDLRGQGVGTHLLKAFEDHAIASGCEHIHLDTFSFQAPKLYEACGYELFAELEDYPKGHSRRFYRKSLNRAPRAST